MKKVLLSFALLLGLSGSAWAYDFSAVAPTGQTLYYEIVNASCMVVAPRGIYNDWVNFIQPTGVLTIPASVTYSGYTYPVTSIDSCAFYNCNGLTSVTIPNSVTTIGGEAFYNCSGLTSVTIPNSVTSIGGWVFYGCSGLTSAVYNSTLFAYLPQSYNGSYTIPSGITTICGGAFKGCSGLTSVTIPNSVTTIGVEAFKNCTGLTSVTIPNSVTTIGGEAFYNCSGLTSVTIPNSVTTICRGAFEGCSGLTSVTIPNSVTSIGGWVFYGCSSLTSVTIPNSVTYIGSYAFYYCSSLTSITIPNSVTSIGERAFYNCSSLTSVTIPNSVTRIGYSAFSNCTSLTSVTIPNSVTTICGGAFEGCSGLTSVIIENAAASIGDSTFKYCLSLTTVIFGNSITSIGNSAFGYCKNLTSISIPNSVTGIGNEAFCNCYGLTSLSIGSSVTYIGAYAFYQCYRLPSITIPSSVTTIGQYAFAYCTSSSTIYIPSSVNSIGDLAFCYVNNICGNVSSGSNYPYGAKNVCGREEDGFIYSNSYKTTVTGYVGSDSVITIPNTVTNIQNSAFFGSMQLTSVSIPSTVNEIGDYAISNCFSLTHLSMPTSYSLGVGYNAFYSNPKLTSVNSLVAATNNPTMGYARIVFPNTWNSTVNFTATPYEGYSFVDWSDGYNEDTRMFPITASGTYTANFTPENSTLYTITATSANPTMGSVTGGGTYNEGTTATLTATANSGYHFTQWQDGNTQNPRTVTVTGNATYTAYFAVDADDDDCPAVTTFPWNATFDEALTCWKTVDADGDGYNWGYYDGAAYSESYSYFDGTHVGLTPDNWLISRQIQVPASGNYTLSWRAQGANNDYYNEHYTVYVSTTGDNPANFTTQLYSETLNTPNVVSRSVSLQNYHGQTIRVAFRHHNTNDVFVLLLADVKIASSSQGIDDVDATDINVYVDAGRIVVDGAEGATVQVYDMMGRLIQTLSAKPTAHTSNQALPAGVYLVKVGDAPARRVVVIR